MAFPTTLARPGTVIVPFAAKPLIIPEAGDWVTLVDWQTSSNWMASTSKTAQVTLVVDNIATVDWRIVPSQSGRYGDLDQATILTKTLEGAGEQSTSWDNRLKRYFSVQVKVTDGEFALVYFEVARWLFGIVGAPEGAA